MADSNPEKPKESVKTDTRISAPDLDVNVDLMGFVSANVFFLRCTGQWFHDHPTGSAKYWRCLAVKHLVLFVVFTIPISGEILYLTYNHDDISKLAESLYLFLSEIFTPVKVALFSSNKLIILDLLSDLHSETFRPTEPEHANIVRAAMKRCRAVTFTFSTICLTCVSVGCLVPIAQNFEMHPTNAKYPYVDVMTSPAYEILYAFDVLYKPLGVIMYCCVETLPPVLMACAIAQLEILAFNLEHLDLLACRQLQRQGISADIQQDHQILRAMKDLTRMCMRHHSYIVNFVKKVENAYALQTGSQFLLSAIIICLTGIQFFSIEDPMHQPIQLMWMFTYLSAMVMAVFLVCYFGQDLISKSELLMTAAYNGPWLSMDHELALSLVIFRERCQRSLSVRAAKFFHISLVTFTSLMRWSFNVFAMMNQMK